MAGKTLAELRATALRRADMESSGTFISRAEANEYINDAAGEFHDEFLAAGTIPVALIRWEMTGNDDQVAHLFEKPET